MATNADRLARIRELVASGTNLNMHNAEQISYTITDEDIRREANEVFAAGERSRLAPASSAASSAASAAFAPAPASAAGAGTGALPPAAKSTLSANSFNIYNSGVASPAAAAAAAPSPISAAILPIKTPDEVKAALRGSLESMITIARTGGVDLGTVRGLPTGPGAAAEAAPKIIIVKDPTGASICATEMFAEEIPIGDKSFPTALKFYIETTEDLSKPAPGKLWGTRVPPAVQFKDRLAEVILQKINPLTRKITSASPSKNLTKPGEEGIKTKYLEFLSIFEEDMTALRTTYKESDVKDLADYLNQKFQRSLRKALEVDELRHAMKHGKSALVGAAAGAVASRNVAVAQAAELQTRIQELERKLVDANPEEHARLQEKIDRLTRISAAALSKLSTTRTALTAAESARGALDLEKRGKAAEAEYAEIVRRNETLGDILSILPTIIPAGATESVWRSTLKNNINERFDAVYPTNATDDRIYQQWINKLKMYHDIKTYVDGQTTAYNLARSKTTKSPADYNLMSKYDEILKSIAFMDKPDLEERKTLFTVLLQRLQPLPQSGGGYSRRITRHRARRNRAKTQRRLRR